jgi:hypothetical protein
MIMVAGSNTWPRNIAIHSRIKRFISFMLSHLQDVYIYITMPDHGFQLRSMAARPATPSRG